MDFACSAEQNAIVEMATRFARERLEPNYNAREKAGCIDREIAQEMGAMGLLGPELPQRFGGLGVGRVTTGLIVEAIGGGDINLCYHAVNVSLVGQIIAEHAQKDLAAQWVPQMISGKKLPSIALTEPRGGSDAANLIMKAGREGDHYVLNGEKASITFATQADVGVIFARTGTVEAGAKGISAFLVSMDLPGISRTASDDLGSRSVGRGSLFFDGVRVPVSCRLGDEGRGFVQVMQGFDFSRALIGLQCLGAAKKSLQETWAYAKDRRAFDKPLVAFQGVSFPLAEAETFLEAARLLCLKTLWLKDHDLPHTAEAAMCKWWAPKLAAEIIQTCLLTHGHSAYSASLPYEQRLRDVLGLQIGDGTAQIMKLIIARQKAGRSEVPA
jgi:cyclohexanecarboxyl-CoA dehydrogenase